MTVRNLAAAGLVLLALGGPLLLAGLDAETLGTAGLLGVAAVWLGLLASFAALFRLGQVEHRLLRTQGESVRTLTAEVARLRSPDGADEVVLERLTALETELRASFDASRRELLQIVDARVLGIHETVRDLGRGADS